jgi:two-component system heavy metal sensor histidine kinase CusS
VKPLSSRLKIALLSAGISGVVLLGFGVATWGLIRHQRLEALDREIRTLAARHPGLFGGRGQLERLQSAFQLTFGEDYTNHVIFLLQDSSGRTVFRSPHWPEAAATLALGAAQVGALGSAGTHTNAAAPPAPGPSPARAGRGRSPGRGGGWGGPPGPVTLTEPPRFVSVQAPDGTWRVGVLRAPTVTLLLGLNQHDVDSELNHLRNAFLAALPVALLLVGLGGWVVAGRALRPLKLIAETAERVTARGLDQRIADPGDSPEASRLIQVLNRMMDRLEASFRQATRFSADASHELKTPLAIMQGELENALQAAAPGSPEQQLFSRLLEETQRLNTITRSLLLLAQADAGQLKLNREPLDLSAELEGLIEDARLLASEQNLSFDLQVQPQLWVQGDRALLHTALFNLLSNAVKYNQPNGRVSVTLAATADEAVLTVGNTGPGIPPEDQPHVFDRFYRVRRSAGPTPEGLGLGLSLAREIIRAHGGDLRLEASRPGWTCFELRLNRVQAPQ